MESASFDATPEFARFGEGVRKLLTFPKARLDQLVKDAANASPRKADSNSAGRKPVKKRKR
jgi:hypothetical protein